MSGSPHDPFHVKSLFLHQKLKSDLSSEGFTLFLGSKFYQEVLDVTFSVSIVVLAVM